MADGYGPRFVVGSPAPEPLRYTLLDVARIVAEDTGRWANGLTVAPRPRGPLHTWETTRDGNGTATKVMDQGVGDAADFDALTVYLPVHCTGRGVAAALAAFEADAREAFAAFEPHLVEAIFWERELATADADTLAAGAVTLKDGISLLEEAIGDTGEGGVIHVGRRIGSRAAIDAGLTADGPIMRTKLGTPVVIGAGYPGTSPDGDAPADADAGWAYATGPLEARRSGVEVVPGDTAAALDRGTNDYVILVERDYLVSWDRALHAAVLIDPTL